MERMPTTDRISDSCRQTEKEIKMDERKIISDGESVLGIEFGSTRIKGVLISQDGTVLATGFHEWENSYVNGIWTYSLEEIHAGLQDCYASVKADVQKKYGVKLTKLKALGVSAMMHGIIALDKDGKLLTPFQTWRNTNTEKAADELSELFDFNIPQRWTSAHVYQCILDEEKYCRDFSFVTTLAGYIHYLLTGEKVIGIGDASGIFPIDSETKDYDAEMEKKFDDLISDRGYSWKMRDIFPKVLCAGEDAGHLTKEGAALLDPEGDLQSGTSVCPPEGDAGTGMVATNSVAKRTGNISAGTSTFAMVVLEKKLSRMYREIDMVTTPDGYPVAMSHANNGTSDLNAWVKLFEEYSTLMGYPTDIGEIYQKLYTNTLDGDPDCGGLMAYGLYSGENITKLNEGRLSFMRTPDAAFNLKNFMRVHLYTSLGAVKMGMDILMKDEHVQVDRIMGHGGFFKTRGVGQRYLAAAVNAPVTVMATAGEGGAWGIALLASYLVREDRKQTLPEFLDSVVFSRMEGSTIAPDPREVEGFEVFEERYKKCLTVEKEAIKAMDW